MARSTSLFGLLLATGAAAAAPHFGFKALADPGAALSQAAVGSGPSALSAPVPPVRPVVRVSSSAGAASPEPAQEMVAVRDRLMSQLQRAAAAGMIDFAEREEGSGEPSGAPSGGAETEGGAKGDPAAADEGQGKGAEPATGTPTSLDGEIGIWAPSVPGIDRERIAAADAGRPGCASNETLALPDPGEAGSAAVRLAGLRAQVLGEFDRPRVDETLRLVRLHLSLGQTVEARLLLSELVPEHPETGLLMALASIIDTVPLPDGHALLTPGCPGHHVIWHAVAAEARGDLEAALARAPSVVRLLPTLPRALFHRFALRLGVAAIELGDAETASKFAALASRARSSGPPSAQELLLQTGFARFDGDAAALEAGLLDLWAHYPGPPEAESGLLMLAEAVLDGEIAAVGPTHRLRLDLGTIGVLSASAATRERALILEARLAARDFGREAGVELLALGREDGTVGDDAYAEAIARLAPSDADAPQTGPLALAYETAAETYGPALADPAFRTALALSYAEIGLPAKGEGVLTPEDRDRPRVEAALARAYLEAGELADAERLAVRLPDGSERRQLLSRILAEGGDAPAALELAAQESQVTPSERARLAWKAGDWSAAASALEAVMDADGGPAEELRRRVALDRMASGERGTSSGGAEGAPVPAPTMDAVGRYLEPLRRETDSIREILENG